jgi:beta-phosphoglucomutase-like phosphatase (HAD superfamily)
MQAKYNASEVATWEAEQRRQAEEELAAMEQAAELEARLRDEEAQVRLGPGTESMWLHRCIGTAWC